MNLTLKLVMACGAALLVLCAVGVFSYRLAERSDRDQHWVTHTHDVLEQLDALDFDVKPPANLDGTREAVASLERLTADNPVQQRSLQRLTQLIFAPAFSNGNTVESRDPAFEVRLNQQAAPIIAQMKQEEDRLRTLRLAAMQASSREIKFVVVLGNTLTVLFVFIAAQMVRHEMARRRTAEASVRSNEERFRLMSASVKEYAILHLDPQGYITSWNTGAERIKGYRAEEIIGQHFSKFYSPEDVAAGKTGRELETAAREGQCEDEGWRVRRDGSRFWANVVITAVRDQNGRLLGFNKVTRDLTEKRRTDEALRRQNAQLEAANNELDALMSDLRERQEMFERLFDSAPDALLLTNEAGTITAINKQSEALFGYRREELVGQSVELLVPEELRAGHGSHREQYFHAPTVRPMGRGLNLSARRKDGTLCPVDLTLSPMRSKDGNVVLTAVRDITEQRRAQEDIKRQNAKLEAANKELDAFSYSVAHDLRAPLRAIDGFSQALVEDLQDKLNDESRANLQRVRKATARMAELIDDLLKLARISRYQADKKQVDLSRLANDVAAQLQSSDNNGRHVEFAIKQGLTAIGDRELLRIVFENLMGNAWKFTSKKPDARIEFGLQNGGGERTFFVRDNGPGFDMQYANKLFGVFQRLHRESEFPGTGVGLATVQRIIHRHGGKIWAEAALEKGATFYFVL